LSPPRAGTRTTSGSPICDLRRAFANEVEQVLSTRSSGVCNSDFLRRSTELDDLSLPTLGATRASALLARLQQILQRLEVCFQLTFRGLPHDRLGELEEPARLAFTDDGDLGAVAQVLEVLVHAEGDRAL
jgi:hypothetical protein